LPSFNLIKKAFVCFKFHILSIAQSELPILFAFISLFESSSIDRKSGNCFQFFFTFMLIFHFPSLIEICFALCDCKFQWFWFVCSRFCVFDISFSLSDVFFRLGYFFFTSKSKAELLGYVPFPCFMLSLALQWWFFFQYSNILHSVSMWNNIPLTLFLCLLLKNWMICDCVLLSWKIWDSHSLRILA